MHTVSVYRAYYNCNYMSYKLSNQSKKKTLISTANSQSISDPPYYKL